MKKLVLALATVATLGLSTAAFAEDPTSTQQHVQPAQLAHRQPQRVGGVRDEGPAGAGKLVAGSCRHSGAEVFPQSGRAGRSGARS